MKRNERDEPRCERCGHFNHDNVWCEVDVIVSSGPVFEMCGCMGEEVNRCGLDKVAQR